jgi:hypothetical protein
MRHVLSIALLGLSGAVGAAACHSSKPGPNLRMCALVSGCNDGLSISFGEMCESLSLLLENDMSLLSDPDDRAEAEIISCYGSATSCDELAACGGTPTAAQVAPCGGAGEMCSGSTLVFCPGPQGLPPDGQPTAIDCAKAGFICGSDGEGSACGSALCEDTSTKPRCDGDSLVTCVSPGGVLQAQTCKGQIAGCQGNSCQTFVADTCGVVDGVAQCVGTGDACDPTSFPSKCNGTYIVTCTGGRVAAFDCASTALTPMCAERQPGFPGCVAGTACQDTDPESCSEGVISFCFFGAKTTLQCTDYGFKGCSLEIDSTMSIRAACGDDG